MRYARFTRIYSEIPIFINPLTVNAVWPMSDLKNTNITQAGDTTFGVTGTVEEVVRVLEEASNEVFR